MLVKHSEGSWYSSIYCNQKKEEYKVVLIYPILFFVMSDCFSFNLFHRIISSFANYTNRMPTIISVLALGVSYWTVRVMWKIQKRNERLTYYQYKLGNLTNMSEKIEKLFNSPDLQINKIQLLDILLTKKWDFIKLQKNMKDEFWFED